VYASICNGFESGNSLASIDLCVKTSAWLRCGPRWQKPRDTLRNAAASLAEHRDFPTAWRHDAFDRLDDIDELIRRLTKLGELGP
jgi:hypothetical protein